MTLDEFRQDLRDKRASFYSYPDPIRTYWHWTAGHYYQVFGDYHYCVTGDGEIVNTRPLDSVPAATWMRNLGSIAIALCCCYKGRPEDLGPEPPTVAQIETVAKMSAIISGETGYPIDPEYFMTHGEAADQDGYGLYSGDPDCRWDLHILHDGDEWGSGGDVIREMAKKYQKGGV